jgi:hypothetical protein
LKACLLQVIDLPTLPPNARYIFHQNECFDWGTFGWALSTQDVSLAKYKYFIFMNSSIRGPFLPSYLKVLDPFLCKRLRLACAKVSVIKRSQLEAHQTDHADAYLAYLLGNVCP